MQKKRSSLKFGPSFCPKLGKEQKKRSSLKFGPSFCPKLHEEQKKEVFTPFWFLTQIWSKTKRGNQNSSAPGYDVLPKPPSCRSCLQCSQYLWMPDRVLQCFVTLIPRPQTPQLIETSQNCYSFLKSTKKMLTMLKVIFEFCIT